MENHLTLKQLRYFAALAETGHYRKAAERVGISQPSLSLQIGNLEAALGVRLVERGRSGAVLTPEGREVLSRAQQVLHDVEALRDTSEQMKAGFIGTLRLGSSPTLGPYLLPRVFQSLHEQYPDLRLVVRDGTPTDLLSELLAGQHDLILTQLPVHSTDVQVARVLREPLHLVVALDHPLAGAALAKDADLKDQNMLALTRGFTLHNQVADLARDVGANLRQDYEGTSLDALRQMTALNMGVTFLPGLYVRSEIPKARGDVAVVPYRSGRLFRSIGLVWRKTSRNHAAFEVLAREIRTVAKTRYRGVVQAVD